MSDTTKLTAELPKFKDKVMYVSSAISDTKLETSYVISSSFKGIVRLSPNNHTIVREDATHQLSVEDERSQGLIYSDAIVFDNDSSSAIKSECDITKRMIIASESSGYLVNFRLSDRDIEFDNLGVIGITQASSIAIFTTAENDNNNTFYLGNSRMPVLAKSGSPSIEQLHKSPQSIQDESKRQLHGLGDYDERKIKIIDEGDKSFVTYGVINEDGERVFRYRRTQTFIKDLVQEALLSLQTIPTGSIHFVPVTADQYQALCHPNDNTFQRPNATYINAYSNRGDKDNPFPTTDPIVRDFLLCDGRKYYNKDFPELAKILWKEKIQSWTPTTHEENSGTFVNVYYPNENTTAANDYEEQKEGDKTFRVPDLRHMFIAGVHANPQLSLSTDQIKSMNNHKSQGTGSYFPDNLPKYSRHYKEDNHRHFIAAGTYDYNLFSADETFHTKLINNYIVVNPKTNSLSLNVNPVNYKNSVEGDKNDKKYVGLMYLANHPFFMGNKEFNGFSTRIKSIPQSNHIGVDSIPAHYFASIPMNDKQGAKSDNLASYTIGTVSDRKTKFVGKTSNCILSVWHDENANTLHGHENSPVFFAMLPLIKI